MRRVYALATAMAVMVPGVLQAATLLSGPTANAGSYGSADLAGLANAGNTVTADGFKGISLWGLLGGSDTAVTNGVNTFYGAITTTTPAGSNTNNPILRYYLLATGSNGLSSVVSLGEIDPRFHGTGPSAFLAFSTAANQPLAAPTLVVPGAAARTIPDVVSIQLLSVGALAQGGGAPSTGVMVSGLVDHPGLYDMAALQALGPTVISSGYSGISLATALDPTAPSLTDLVVAKATDGYAVVFALAELDPALGGNLANILAFHNDQTNQDVFRTILPGDAARGRWVSNLDGLEVYSATPIPAALPLFIGGLAALSVIGRRRRRASAAGA